MKEDERGGDGVVDRGGLKKFCLQVNTKYK